MGVIALAITLIGVQVEAFQIKQRQRLLLLLLVDSSMPRDRDVDHPTFPRKDYRLRLMHMVPPLHQRLQPQRNQQANGDGQNMQQKIAHAVRRVFRRMHFEHGSSLPAIPADCTESLALSSNQGNDAVHHRQLARVLEPDPARPAAALAAPLLHCCGPAALLFPPIPIALSLCRHAEGARYHV